MNKMEFEEADGVCPGCDNGHREGRPYTVKWHYDKHVKVCKSYVAMTDDTEPEVKIEPVVETPQAGKEYTVLVRRDDRDKWDIKYHGGNQIMAERAATEWRNQAKVVKVKIE